MRPFFDADPGSDEYCSIRDGINSQCLEVRSFIEEIWPQCAEFLDPGICHDAHNEFHQRWWELYLTHALLVNGIALVPRQQRQPRKSGPDLFAIVGGNEIWIEAVTAFAGTTLDAVPERVLGIAGDVPDSQIKLRLQTALDSKLKKYHHYRSKGWIRESDGYVVAVNAGRVPKAVLERTVPRIVACVFPIGMEVVHLNVNTREFSELTYQHQVSVKKVGGEEIPTNFFLDTDWSGISAVLCSNFDAFNKPSHPGADLVMVHNPLADAPLPRGSLRVGLEYHAELHSLDQVWRVHRTVWGSAS